MRHDRECNLAGFTLIEIVVAMGLVVIVAATAGIVTHTMDIGQAAVRRAAADHDREMTSWRLLESLAARAELRTGDVEAFEGSPDHIRLPTWCPSAGGWLERCVATLESDALAGETFGIHVRAGSGVHLVASLGLSQARPVFRFLSGTDGGLEIAKTWSSRSTLPLAIAIVTGRDTLVLRIGERG